MLSMNSCCAARSTGRAYSTVPLDQTRSVSCTGTAGANAIAMPRGVGVTFSAPIRLAVTNPFVPDTGYHHSVHRSLLCGAKPRWRNGVNVLCSAA